MNEEFAAHPAAEACGTVEEIRFDARRPERRPGTTGARPRARC